MLNDIVKMVISYYLIYPNHFDRQRQLYVKLTIFLLLPVSTLNNIVQDYCTKSNCGEI